MMYSQDKLPGASRDPEEKTSSKNANGRRVLQYCSITFGGDQPPSTRSLESARSYREEFIMRSFMISAASIAALSLVGAAFAQQGQLGGADEAKAMLLKAVAAVKADRDVALIMFQKGEGGFKDRDLYVFCVRMSDGKTLAGPVAVPAGTDVRTLKDPTGKPFGIEQYAAYQKPEGQITEISYMFPKPGTTTPAVAKVAFVTRVGDLGCGVGYYK
jgi:hypothetical protein